MKIQFPPVSSSLRLKKRNGSACRDALCCDCLGVFGFFTKKHIICKKFDFYMHDSGKIRSKLLILGVNE